ncbi:uncharacterized protein zgc:174906 [Synchiropus splendidus]|uniref:uncharacterized protein zgc:174906 n=1 Tax=Synchiropus splendidus TaxID=270530 RepID=UPI00237EDC9F|nr:uncharacterized protein zgc:174906 [Synchiropus splendidus]
MAETSAAAAALLRSQKAKLIDILSADSDFLLQHADARSLLSASAYKRARAVSDPCGQVRDVLDHVLQRGPAASQGLLDLLGSSALQETFPLLKDLTVERQSSGETDTFDRHGFDQRRLPGPPVKRRCVGHAERPPGLVTEKQLMMVARVLGRSWKAIGRQALEIPTVKLEQVEEDHQTHVERVFAMLRIWQSCQRDQATAAHLHFLLSQEDCALPADAIHFLLETD